MEQRCVAAMDLNGVRYAQDEEDKISSVHVNGYYLHTV